MKSLPKGVRGTGKLYRSVLEESRLIIEMCPKLSEGCVIIFNNLALTP